MLEKKLNRSVLITKWHSLTMCIVKVVIDSLLKNNGKSTSIVVGICIEKSMDFSQPIFHKEH